MSNQELSKQLIKRIILNLGFNFKDGLFNSLNKINKKLKLEEEDYSIKEYTIYGSECFTDSGVIKSIAVNIGSDDNPDLVIAIVQENTVLALRYSVSEIDNGMFLTRHKEKWVDMSILHQLNLTSAIELITQNGLPWVPATDQDSLYEIVASILSES